MLKETSKWYKFPCQIIQQGLKAPKIAILSADAYDISELSTISRVSGKKEGYQRIVNKRRAFALTKYVDIPESIIPTSIVLATEDNSDYIKLEKMEPIENTKNQWSAILKLRIFEGKKPCLVIDGQHRLEGIIHSLHDSYPVPITLLLGADIVTQMLHFIIINNKATRIPTSHINELMGSISKLNAGEEKRLQTLLGQLGVKSISDETFVAELNSEGKIFANILDFPSNKLQLVSSASLKGLIKSSRANGFLSYIEDDDYKQLIAFNLLWEGIKKKFSKRWMYERSLGTQFSNKKIKKTELNKNKKIFHSGAISVLGKIVDRELSSVSYRKIWNDNIEKVPDIVANDILANLPEKFWNDVVVDNTSKRKKELSLEIEDNLL
ncbi:MAG: DGQHR domain-containing protein [Halarcobacter sp.]